MAGDEADNGQTIESMADAENPEPVTHEWVACIVQEYFAAEGRVTPFR